MTHELTPAQTASRVPALGGESAYVTEGDRKFAAIHTLDTLLPRAGIALYLLARIVRP